MKNYMCFFLLLLTSFVYAQNTQKPSSKVVAFSEVKWGYLNPLRGDKSPGAANLWGDRTSQSATGMLVRFNEGFSSPPHIHNVSYRGIVIKGLLHNDDPSADEMWLPAGSFWTQPAGEAHITAAKGVENLAYIEIDHGPYLVKPVEKAFDNGQKPVNVDPSNLFWLDASNLTWFKWSGEKSQTPEVAFLWGSNMNDQLNGLMIKFPAHFSGHIISQSDVFKAVMIQGKLTYGELEGLKPGSFFESQGRVKHPIIVNDKGTIIYIRTRGKVKIVGH